MTTLTTSNVKTILEQWRQQDLDIYLEACLDKTNPKAGYLIRFIPGYSGDLYKSEALVLFAAPAKNRIAKQLKSKQAIFNLAEKHQIKPSRLLWK